MKIILTDALREHMKCHDREFLKGWQKTFNKIEESSYLEEVKEGMEVIVVNFQAPIGQSMLIETTAEDTIVYAKRQDREIYTRFVKGREPEDSYQVTCIFRKSEEVEGAYELITMYVGDRSEKEPEDINIGDKEELIRSLKFWKDHARIYTPENIQQGSERGSCPYQNLFSLLDE